MPSAISNAIPTMLYDGDCGFCARWVERWRMVTGDKILYETYQTSLGNYPQLTEAQCRQAVQLIMPDGKTFSGAHAVFRALSLSGRYGLFLRAYERIPLVRALAERIYQWIAHRRAWFSRFFGVRECKL